VDALLGPERHPATPWIAAQTGGAYFAGSAIGNHNRISGFEGGYAFAYSVDYAGTFVAEQYGKRHSKAAHVFDMKICMADAGCYQFDAYFVRSRVVDDDIYYFNGGIRLIEHGRAALN
jgi:hypothetical protein